METSRTVSTSAPATAPAPAGRRWPSAACSNAAWSSVTRSRWSHEDRTWTRCARRSGGWTASTGRNDWGDAADRSSARFGAVRPSLGHRGAPRPLRRPGAGAVVAGDPGGAGRGTGRGRPGTRGRRQPDPRARPCRAPGPGAGRRADAGDLALDAGPDHLPAAGAAGVGPRVGLLGRHRPGPDRHLGGADHAGGGPDRRAGPAPRRVGGAVAGAPPSRHGDVRAYTWPARPAHHLRLQGRRLGL